jgi:hypothetical protein
VTPAAQKSAQQPYVAWVIAFYSDKAKLQIFQMLAANLCLCQGVHDLSIAADNAQYDPIPNTVSQLCVSASP